MTPIPPSPATSATSATSAPPATLPARNWAWYLLAGLALLAALRLAQRCGTAVDGTALVQDLFYFAPAAAPVVLASLSRRPIAAVGAALAAVLLYLALPTAACEAATATAATNAVPTGDIAWLIFSLPVAALGAFAAYRLAGRRLA